MNTSAAGQFLGYHIQTIRLFCLLLELNEDIDYVSLEVFDDLGVVYKTGEQLLEQLKSDTSGNNPLSEKAEEFWKTLRNWVDICNDGKNDISPDNTEFHITVYRKNKKIGDIQDKFHKAKTEEDALREYNYAKDYFEKNNVSKDTKKHQEVFFDRENKPTAIGIIKHLAITISDDILWDVKSQLQRNYAIPVTINYDYLIDHCIGWISTRVIPQIINTHPCTIAREDFHKEFSTFQKILTNDYEWYSPSQQWPDEQIANKLNAVFVRQLRFIEHNEKEIINGINDFLTAAHARTEWSKKGLVNTENFEILEDNLWRNWKNKKDLIELNYGDKLDRDKGRLLLINCHDSPAKLAGKDLQLNFISGSYHALANAKVIGWHPNYMKLLNPGENYGDT